MVAWSCQQRGGYCASLLALPIEQLLALPIEQPLASPIFTGGRPSLLSCGLSSFSAVCVSSSPCLKWLPPPLHFPKPLHCLDALSLISPVPHPPTPGPHTGRRRPCPPPGWRRCARSCRRSGGPGPPRAPPRARRAPASRRRAAAAAGGTARSCTPRGRRRSGCPTWWDSRCQALGETGGGRGGE
jgi:hypothetical protein